MDIEEVLAMPRVILQIDLLFPRSRAIFGKDLFSAVFAWQGRSETPRIKA